MIIKPIVNHEKEDVIIKPIVNHEKEDVIIKPIVNHKKEDVIFKPIVKKPKKADVVVLKPKPDLDNEKRVNPIFIEHEGKPYEPICVYEGEETEINLIANSPEQYIKSYKLKVISYDIEHQLIKNKNIIRETLSKDLTIHKGLKANTLFILI